MDGFFCIFPQTYLIFMDLRIQNLEGHQNCINGLKVMVIFIVSLSLVKIGIPLDIFAVSLLRSFFVFYTVGGGVFANQPTVHSVHSGGVSNGGSGHGALSGDR